MYVAKRRSRCGGLLPLRHSSDSDNRARGSALKNDDHRPGAGRIKWGEERRGGGEGQHARARHQPCRPASGESRSPKSWSSRGMRASSMDHNLLKAGCTRPTRISETIVLRPNPLRWRQQHSEPRSPQSSMPPGDAVAAKESNAAKQNAQLVEPYSHTGPPLLSLGRSPGTR